MEFIHTQKNVKVTPKKLRKIRHLVIDMDPREALDTLPHIRRRGAEIMYKAIKTAVANADENGAGGKELVLKEIQINEAMKLKRFRAGARGMAKPYAKRWSHIRIVLESKFDEKKGAKKQAKPKSIKTQGKDIEKLTKKEIKKEVKKDIRGKTKKQTSNVKKSVGETRKVPSAK